MADEMKPQYAPKTLEQKLGYLVEECGETLAAVGKTQRWGPGGRNPELPLGHPLFQETNASWVLRELHDLKRSIELVEKALGEWQDSNG